MKIDKQTQEVLKNFLLHNPSILLTKDKLRMVGVAENIRGEYEHTLDFPNFGIYDLKKFISVMNELSTDEVDFFPEENYCVVGKKPRQFKFFASAEENLKISKDDVKFPQDFELKFTLKNDELTLLKKLSLSQGFSHLNIHNKNGYLQIVVKDKGIREGNNFSIDLEDKVIDNRYDLYIPKETLMFISSDYDVRISSKLIMELSSTSIPLKYFIKFQTGSKFV